MIKPQSELLAPAKDKITAIEAINCGADAVYMGASAFGARRNAPNSLDDIKEVVNYAHKFWAKVFITVNTILDDNELDEAVELVKALDRLGVDAVIVQDLGLLKRLIELNLQIPIHMSTQCDNRDVEKVSFFNKIGVSRVVLARELSLEKIKEIHQVNPNLELEAFVHGALCVSYSGQCYLSQYIGGRSANRGECAQPCRKKYTVESVDGKILAKDIHALCLKDFNASRHLEKMLEAGIFSFKIEGRLKETGYVKNVVAYYRGELDKCSTKISSGKSFYPFTPNPEKSFNRGFTDYFLEKRKDCFNFNSPKSIGEFLGVVVEVKKDCFSIKTKNEIHPQDGLVIGTDGCLVNRVSKIGDIVTIFPNKKLKLKAGDKVFRNLDVEFEKLLAKPVKRQIGVNFKISSDSISVTDEDGVQVELAFGQTEIANNPEKIRDSFTKQLSKTGDSDFYVMNIEFESNPPFVPVSGINQLRRDVFEALMEKRLKSYVREAQKPMQLAQYYKDSVDYRANIHNDDAKCFYEQCGVKVEEYSLEKKLPQRQIELMRTKHCIKFALGLCKSPLNLVLRDEKGVAYPLKFNCKNCEMAVMSPA